ncbi:MAG: right-handed parallel beta-helix repeat-containing protein [Planctomycetaceae bacterium]
MPNDDFEKKHGGLFADANKPEEADPPAADEHPRPRRRKRRRPPAGDLYAPAPKKKGDSNTKTTAPDKSSKTDVATANRRTTGQDMLCLRCGQTVNGFDVDGSRYSCPKCSKAVPKRYVDDYNSVTRVSMNLAGRVGHGKTEFLKSVCAALADYDQLWPDFRFGVMDDEDAALFPEKGLKLATPTQEADVAPIGLWISGINGARDIHMILVDVPGEFFDNSATIQNKAIFVAGGAVTTLILSVTDKNTQPSFLLDALERAYTSGVTVENRSLVVVLSKADELVDLPGFPDIARTCLQTEETQHLGQLEKLSAELRQWLPGAPFHLGNFIKVADSYFSRVAYTAVSSLGGPPDDTAAGIKNDRSPRNVLSPLTWLFRLSLPRIKVRIYAPRARAEKESLSAETDGEVEQDDRPEEAGGSLCLLSQHIFHDFQIALEKILEHDPELHYHITLPSGIHRLDAGMKLKTNLRIVGAEEAVVEVAGAGLHVAGGMLELSRVRFEAAGKNPGTLLRIRDSVIRIEKCTFKGAVHGVEDRTSGIGFRVGGNSKGSVEQCVFEKNQTAGILVTHNASVKFRQNRLDENKTGFVLTDSSNTVIEGNECINSDHFGIHAANESVVQLTENRCRNNTRGGIQLLDNVTGTVTECVCETHPGISKKKQLFGIRVEGHASVDVRKNLCAKHKETGIEVRSFAREMCRVTGNTVQNNQTGILVSGRSTLEENSLHQNVVGIRISESATDVILRDNDNSGNSDQNLDDQRRTGGVFRLFSRGNRKTGQGPRNS